MVACNTKCCRNKLHLNSIFHSVKQSTVTQIKYPQDLFNANFSIHAPGASIPRYTPAHTHKQNILIEYRFSHGCISNYRQDFFQVKRNTKLIYILLLNLMFKNRNHQVACFVTHLYNPLLFSHHVTTSKILPTPLSMTLLFYGRPLLASQAILIKA